MLYLFKCNAKSPIDYFNQIPTEVLKESDKIRVLDISYNKIAALPAEIGQCVILKSLTVDHNKLRMLCLFSV